MPEIYKPRKKTNYVKRGRSKTASQIYNTKMWKDLRSQYYQDHPLCELCLLEGKVTPADEIHHKKEILSGNSQEEMERLAYDYFNLQSLCEYHHHLIHNEKRQNNKTKL